MTTRATPIIGAILLASASGCATREGGGAVDSPAGETVRADTEPALVAAAPERDAPVVEPPPAPPEETAGPAEDRGPADRLAPTGEAPSWWFERPVVDGGRLTVCAEAPGADLRAARGAAVAEGLRLVRAALALGAGESPSGFRVERAWVAPRSSGSDYTGYVLVSADASER